MAETQDRNFRIVNDAHSLMVQELRKIRPQKSTNQGVMIRCPFHADGTPSLSINLTHTSKKPAGLWMCFGCPERGLWNKLARKLGLRTVDERAAQQMTQFHGRRAKDSLLTVEDPLTKTVNEWELDFVEPWPVDRKWRGFPGEFVNAFGGLLAVDTRRRCEILLLPVNIGGEAIGYVKANLQKEKGQLSYVNSKGEWAANQGLFGYDWAAKLIAEGATVVYVVEGPRDALRLLYYGVPAVAVLGANVWSSSKRDLILSLNADVVILWLDSDAAGVKATNNIRLSLKEHTPVKFVNAMKLLERAKKDYGHTRKKIDVANTPVALFKSVVSRHHPQLRAGAWTSVQG